MFFAGCATSRIRVQARFPKGSQGQCHAATDGAQAHCQPIEELLTLGIWCSQKGEGACLCGLQQRLVHAKTGSTCLLEVSILLLKAGIESSSLHHYLEGPANMTSKTSMLPVQQVGALKFSYMMTFADSQACV